MFRNCGYTVDSSKQDSCGVLVVKCCCVERQQCVQGLRLSCCKQQTGQMRSGGETLLCRGAKLCSGTVAVLLIAAKGQVCSCGGEILLC